MLADVACWMLADVACWMLADVACWMLADEACWMLADVACWMLADVACSALKTNMFNSRILKFHFQPEVCYCWHPQARGLQRKDKTYICYISNHNLLYLTKRYFSWIDTFQKQKNKTVDTFKKHMP